jgi:hypothetical protein
VLLPSDKSKMDAIGCDDLRSFRAGQLYNPVLNTHTST